MNNFKFLFNLIFTLTVINSFGSNQKTILITGGSGYIGSATVFFMLKKGYKIIVIDKKFPESDYFSNSKKIEINKKIINFDENDQVLFFKSDYANKKNLDFIFRNFKIDAVMHLAGSIEISLSLKDPGIFYENNVKKTITLLNCMKKNKVDTIIFSSSAAVYGTSNAKKLFEDNSKNPVNTYGKTKSMIEDILEDYANAYSFKAIALRYFNAAGALPKYDIGERHNPETHIIPLLLKAAYQRTPFYLFGSDYQTSDGTCVRDYLHIYDLAKAHYLSLKYLENKDQYFDVFNLGTGHGYTNNEVIKCVEKITQKKINIIKSRRRLGDPDELIADSSKAKIVLGWFPKMSSLQEIIESAHNFHKKFL